MLSSSCYSTNVQSLDRQRGAAAVFVTRAIAERIERAGPLHAVLTQPC